MAEYRFLDRTTKQPVRLGDVDDQIRAQTGLDKNEDEFSGWYQTLITGAFAALLNVKPSSGSIKQKHIDWLKKEAREWSMTPEQANVFDSLAQKFLLDQYEFVAWRK